MKPPRPALPRRLVLGAALLLALLAALPQRTPTASAQSLQTGETPAASSAAAQEPAARPEAKPAAPAAKSRDHGLKATIEIDAGDASKPDEASVDTGVQVDKGGKRVRVRGLGRDHDYDSIDTFIHDEPAVAGAIVAVVSIVFLSPVLLVALIVLYRLRKARLTNEAMIKLAERGVVPPNEAMASIGGPGASLAASPTAGPLYEQARQVRKRAAWSDLRKGVIMGTIGLGLTFYSMLDDGTPNALGLVLLFVGIGYGVLWWFEERQFRDPGNLPDGSGS